MEEALQLEWDEGGGTAACRYDALVGREEYDAAEVEVSGLQHTEHLQAGEGLAEERDAVALRYAGIYTFEGCEVGNVVVFLLQLAEIVEYFHQSAKGLLLFLVALHGTVGHKHFGHTTQQGKHAVWTLRLRGEKECKAVGVHDGANLCRRTADAVLAAQLVGNILAQVLAVEQTSHEVAAQHVNNVGVVIALGIGTAVEREQTQH